MRIALNSFMEISKVSILLMKSVRSLAGTWSFLQSLLSQIFNLSIYEDVMAYSHVINKTLCGKNFPSTVSVYLSADINAQENQHT